MQVLLRAVLVAALHAALEDGEVAFDRVGVRIAAHVFALGMMHDAMLGKLAADSRPTRV